MCLSITVQVSGQLSSTCTKYQYQEYQVSRSREEAVKRWVGVSELGGNCTSLLLPTAHHHCPTILPTDLPTASILDCFGNNPKL